MIRKIALFLALSALSALSACGVDGAPKPPPPEPGLSVSGQVQIGVSGGA